jgi:hypothetical protein
MGTQKTGMTPPRDEIAVSDETQEIAGRTVRRVDMQQHTQNAFASMQEGSFRDHSGQVLPEHEPEQVAQEIADVLPKFMQEHEADKGVVDKAEMATLLADRANSARKRGDDAMANELQAVLGQILGDSTPKRIRHKKADHPALSKLKRNLGLTMIKPATVEWAKMKWHFAPAPALLDNWVVAMTEQSAGSHVSLKIAASLVGLDDAPLYEVLGVELVGTFEVNGRTITQPLYTKTCDACGADVDVHAAVCNNCDGILDPFDMPLDLRAECAQRMHKFFVKDFGPYEDLHNLYGLMRKVMPDRVFDREKLYPFLKLSPMSSTETATSPSGDEQ